MATVVITPTARHDLETLTRSHSLPADTDGRFRRSVEGLATFPRIGATLDGRWARYRFVLGPWRWMLVVYLYDETLDRVAIVTIQDAGEGSIERIRGVFPDLKVVPVSVLDEVSLEALRDAAWRLTGLIRVHLRTMPRNVRWASRVSVPTAEATVR